MGHSRHPAGIPGAALRIPAGSLLSFWGFGLPLQVPNWGGTCSATRCATRSTRGCAAEAGQLVVFDRAPDRPWAEKIFRRAPSGAGVPVTVWWM